VFEKTTLLSSSRFKMPLLVFSCAIQTQVSFEIHPKQFSVKNIVKERVGGGYFVVILSASISFSAALAPLKTLS
jgi:hypothetical protein